MNVFVTGATGFIGTAIVQELLTNGHQVLGLARTEAAAAKLLAAGAAAHRGDLNDLASLRKGVELTDGTIHAGFIHDFANYAAVCETDRKVIETFGAALQGSNRPLVISSGTMMVRPGHLATEAMPAQVSPDVHPRVLTEQATDALAAAGISTATIRIPPLVHGEDDLTGFTRVLIGIAREKGLAAYVNDGQNRWPAVHYLDAARLFRLALEKNIAGSRFHVVESEGIPFKSIAEAIGKHLAVPVVSLSPEEAAGYFGWLAYFAGLDAPASSSLTQAQLGWQPVQPGLLEDLAQDFYFA